ncbi:polyprenyl diphosphate synthase [Malacoplasma iowae]|uniref:Isoprenyl transferase n=1 Tax=Malacoplasma iowae 695 TaxID=1048830 RepID=A0A6P1LN66_MALIO|nr:polyprenyl diphosphate synthase [Malacoplasma iowae]VEU62112.1 Undecaprenyl pyrophosphate synthase [Mycoplasmopsis fermentans]EGZ31630.1 undecaprenyl diphosphate synthase [Malacoplasma iowae 695]QHG89962.1 polyprenyl diphosphate synthase [Malacoplasma iowae 695]WPL36309.1 polyprenyl diphosphate synthase [Malacoplasma iowae]VEU70500.1 Undecaprenyl pyrophosphate synthase [Malacoplasma iowae]
MNNSLNHIAFIMDGNGRWAKKRNKKRIFGHAQGVKVIPDIIKECINQKIKFVSFFAFSVENWNRPKEEVNFLLSLITKYATKKIINDLNKIDAKVNWIGFEDKLDKKTLDAIKLIVDNTKENKNIIVNIFFNYSGTKDLNNAINLAIKDKDNQKEDIKKYLLTSNLPPIDLLIRTGGEYRISNFSLYDLAYSEIIIENTMWPDYNKELLKTNINEYNNRHRRFGKIEE